MRTANIQKINGRLERAEHSLTELIRQRSLYSADCICFPKDDPPRFFSSKEQEIALAVKCPIHGQRFEPQVGLDRMIAMWMILSRYTVFVGRSEQYRPAWAAAFPDWPHREEDDENVYIVFPDGSKYLAWRKANPHERFDLRVRIKGPDPQYKGPLHVSLALIGAMFNAKTEKGAEQ